MVFPHHAVDRKINNCKTLNPNDPYQEVYNIMVPLLPICAINVLKNVMEHTWDVIHYVVHVGIVHVSK